MCKIPIHGNLLSLKPRDTLRLYFENVNGLPTNNSGCKSDKVKKLRHLWSKLETDVASLAETQINSSLLTHKDSLHCALFRHQPASSIHNNNSNELIGKRQQGGIMMAIRGEVAKHATVTGADPTGLGRWNYIDLVNDGNKVRNISACQSVKSISTLGTACSQRRRCFLARRIDVCPRKLFVLHLTQFTSSSTTARLEVILTVDANEHFVKSQLAKQLQKLGLAEGHCTKFNPEGGPASCFRGRNQIDGVWCARKVTPTAVTLCPFNFGVGDHRAHTVDFHA